MVKRGVGLLLGIIIIISVFQARVFAIGFSDMPNNWSTVALKNAVANNLLNGDNGKIRPNDNLTRAEMATIVNRAFGAKEKAEISKYDDVSKDAWHSDEMAKAVQMGILVGDRNRLNSDNSITREEAFIGLARAFKLSSGNESSLNIFSDKTEVSVWAKEGVASLVSAGYIAGSNNKLNPKQNITRAEFAQVMDKLIKTYINREGTYTKINKGNVMVNVQNVTLKDLTVNGDLIIGDGVGEGDITLDNVKVTGRTVIRGGGENSIKIIGKSNIQNIIIGRLNGLVRVYAEDDTDVGEVIVNGSDEVIIEGSVETISIVSPYGVVSVKKGTIKNVNILGLNAGLIVSEGSKVDTIILDAEKSNVKVLGEVKSINLTKQAEKSSINVAKGGKVEDIEVNAKDVIIDGEGSVKRVEVKADNVKVNTPGTKITVARGTIGVTANGKDVHWNNNNTSYLYEPRVSSSSVGSSKDDEDNHIEADLTKYNAALLAVVEKDYTAESWAIYEAVVKANIVTTKSIQGEVDKATAAILAAQANLVEKSKDPEEPDLTKYNAALLAVSEEDYTAESWAIYQAVVKANVVTTKSSQAEVDAATAAILAAQANLVEKSKDPVLAKIDLIQENVVIGYDKIKVTLNVDNPETYNVGSNELSEFLYNPKDRTFIGVVKTGTKAEELFITKKEVKVKATIVKTTDFLPGVYDVHVTLNVGNPEDYRVSYNGKEFKLKDGVFIGPSHTNAILVEDFVISKK